MISLIHPSRSRPEQALDAALRWLHAADGIPLYRLSIDSSDPYLEEYTKLFPSGTYTINSNNNVVEAVNVAAKSAIGDILVVMSDDFEPFDKWDVAINAVLSGIDMKSGVLKTFDGAQKYIVTLPIITKDYYNRLGYIYHPSYHHMFADSDMTHQADLEKKLIIRNDIVFKHNHYSTKGGQPKDAVNEKADKTWATGETTYLKRCRDKFGLGNVDIFNLSKEAHQAGHVQWLKKKLK